jgi:hypothetical protein
MAKPRRFTVDLPVDLYQKFKVRCVLDDVRMGDVVRKLLEQEYAKPIREAKPEKGRARVKTRSEVSKAMAG